MTRSLSKYLWQISSSPSLFTNAPVRAAIIRSHARRQWLGPPVGDCLNVRRRQRDRFKLQRDLRAVVSPT
jgi:hypothetical protein